MSIKHTHTPFTVESIITKEIFREVRSKVSPQSPFMMPLIDNHQIIFQERDAAGNSFQFTPNAASLDTQICLVIRCLMAPRWMIHDALKAIDIDPGKKMGKLKTRPPQEVKYKEMLELYKMLFARSSTLMTEKIHGEMDFDFTPRADTSIDQTVESIAPTTPGEEEVHWSFKKDSFHTKENNKFKTEHDVLMREVLPCNRLDWLEDIDLHFLHSAGDVELNKENKSITLTLYRGAGLSAEHAVKEHMTIRGFTWDQRVGNGYIVLTFTKS